MASDVHLQGTMQRPPAAKAAASQSRGVFQPSHCQRPQMETGNSWNACTHEYK